MKKERTASVAETIRSETKRVVAAGLLGLAGLIVPGGLIEFNPEDPGLKAELEKLAAVSRKYINRGIPVNEAVRLAIDGQMAIQPKDNFLTEFGAEISRNILGLLPHQINDRVTGEVPANCADTALATHLLFETLGIKGSEVAAFTDKHWMPSFAVIYNSQILTFEKRGWRSSEEFCTELRRHDTRSRLIRVYPK